MRQLVSVEGAAQALGLDPEVPLLGYVMKESFLQQHPDLAQGFYNASRTAKEMLRTDAPWEQIRPRMNAKNDLEFDALRQDFRAGIPARTKVDTNSADRVLRLMAELGGDKLVGAATTLPAGLFAAVK